MRKLRIVWTVCCLAIGLSACATTRPSRLDTAKACADWRWIGISQPEAPCPEVAGWIVRPMFPQLSPPAGDSCGSTRLDVIRNLNRFCVYEVKNPKKKKLRDLALPSAASAGLVRFDQDCAALSLTAAEMGEETSKPDSPDFLAQVERPKTPPADLDYRPKVRLAFLDTQPTGEGVPVVSGNSRHGFTLAQIARQVVCSPEDKGRCAARITTRLALPIIEFNGKDPKQNRVDLEKGGFLGMQSDLATAIVDEVRHWQKEKSQRHLVLNLSMAWDGELFGGLDGGQAAELRAGSQAVYNALQYAASFDVLVLAAAGNRKVAPCTNDGPLLPAAWEKEAPHDGCRVTSGPLLYAVGGLKAGNAPLDNARPGGMPRRVAYGEASTFSGSSVATAVASSIAAVVWSAFPELDSRKVMEILDESGPELFPADFWFDSSPLVSQASQPPLAHKLMLCSALRKAYEKVHGCGTTTPCAFQCDSREEPDTMFRNATGDKDKKIKWLGSCQPWLFPQPEDPIKLSCSGGGCQ